jgi:hypothetical protein
VDDAKASNGLAMRVPKAKAPSWAVQAKTTHFAALGEFGKYHVYAVARWDGGAETGAAFVGGIWDGLKNRSFGGVSFPIGRGPLSRAPAVAAIPNGAPVADGDYHVFDFGGYDLPHSDVSVRVGTTTANLYLDRFVFVREP